MCKEKEGVGTGNEGKPTDDEADGEEDNDDDQPHRHQHHSAHHRLYTLYIVRISNGGMHSAVYRGLFYMLIQFIMCIVTILHLCH